MSACRSAMFMAALTFRGAGSAHPGASLHPMSGVPRKAQGEPRCSRHKPEGFNEAPNHNRHNRRRDTQRRRSAVMGGILEPTRRLFSGTKHNSSGTKGRCPCRHWTDTRRCQTADHRWSCSAAGQPAAAERNHSAPTTSLKHRSPASLRLNRGAGAAAAAASRP